MKVEWTPVEDEIEGQHYLVAYTAEAFAVHSVTIRPRLVEYLSEMLSDEMGMGLIITAHVDEIELARHEQWNLGIFGDPNDAENAAYLTVLMEGLTRDIIYEAHIGLHLLIDRTQDRLKLLKSMAQRLDVVELEAHDQTIRVTTRMAQLTMLVAFKNEPTKPLDVGLKPASATIRKPFRLEKIAPHMLVAYDEFNRELGLIGFDPTNLEYRNNKGRYGLYLVTEAEYDFSDEPERATTPQKAED